MRRAWVVGWGLARLGALVAVLIRLSRGARLVPPVAPEAEPLTDTSVTVIVPARNEERRLPSLLAALASDPTPHQLVVVDDESTDATAEVARASGAEVIAGQPLPPGWVGKPWALQQGLAAAQGTWVVCLDADTVPRLGLLAAVVRRCERDGWDLLSLAARFQCEGVALPALHAAMLTTLVYRFGPPGTGAPAGPTTGLANGQCLVFRREALLAAGGFAGAADHLTDDVALARHLARLGWRVGFLDGTSVLDVRMHEDARDAWRSWGRSLPLPDVTPPWRQALDLATVWLAQGLPLVRVLLRRAGLTDVLLVGVRLATLVATRRAYARPGLGYWLSPFADLPVAARLTQAALRPERTWRGRTYAASARSLGSA